MSDEPLRGLHFPRSAVPDDTPIIAVELELDDYGQMSTPTPTHCAFPVCGARLGPHRVLVGWHPGHHLNTYRCGTCNRTWCPTGPEDPRGRPAAEYGLEAGTDR